MGSSDDIRFDLGTMLRAAAIEERIATFDLEAAYKTGELDVDMDQVEGMERARLYAESVRIHDDEIAKYNKGSIRRRAREMASDAAHAVRNTRLPNDTTLGEGAKRLWQNDVFRKGFYGIAAVSAASMIYRRVNDRPEEVMTGPEFLPGGSAYEGMGGPGVQVPAFNGFEGNYGTTYTIQTNGSYDSASFTAAAEQITGARATGTTHNRRPAFGSIDGAIANGF